MELETTSTFKPEVYRDQIVEALRHSMVEGEHGLSAVPNLIKRAEEAEVWRERVVKVTGEVVEKENFIELIEATPPEGLGGTIKLLKGLCRNDPTAIDAIDRMTVGKQGAPEGNQNAGKTTNNNIMDCLEEEPSSEPAVQGTSNTYALRKLRKDREDLHERVLAGEISPHAAMVQAGFRKKTLTIPADLDGASRILLKHFDPEELIKALQKEGSSGPYSHK
jgi:hypothetical protein